MSQRLVIYLCFFVALASPRHLMAEPAKCKLELRAESPAQVDGCSVQIYQRHPAPLEWRLLRNITPMFDDAGTATAELDPGEYALTVLGRNKAGNLVSASLRRVVLNSPTRTLTVAPLRTITIEQPKGYTVHQIGVRSMGAIGEARARGLKNKPIPKILLGKRDTPSVSLIATSGTSLFAVWDHPLMTEQAMRFSTDRSDLYRVTLKAEVPDAEPTKLQVTFYFPETEFVHTVQNQMEYLTNRRLTQFEYRIDDTRGYSLASLRHFHLVSDGAEWPLGGRLTAEPWAMLLSYFPVDGQPKREKSWRLIYSLGVSDEAGREIRDGKSKLGVVAKWQLPNGTRAPQQNMAKAQADKVAKPETLIDFEASIGWDTQTKTPTSVDKPMLYNHGVYQFEAPPAMRRRAAIYMARLQQYNRIERKVFSKPGPANTTVHLRLNTGYANAGFTGAYMNMPFHTFTLTPHAYDDVVFFAHEMQHNFNDHHGLTMNNRTEIIKQLIEHEKWNAVDNPRAIPPHLRDVIIEP